MSPKALDQWLAFANANYRFRKSIAELKQYRELIEARLGDWPDEKWKAISALALDHRDNWPTVKDFFDFAAKTGNVNGGWTADTLAGELIRLLEGAPYFRKVPMCYATDEQGFQFIRPASPGEKPDTVFEEACPPTYPTPLLAEVVEAWGDWETLRECDLGTTLRAQIRKAAEDVLSRREANAGHVVRGEPQVHPQRTDRPVRPELPQEAEAIPERREATADMLRSLAGKFTRPSALSAPKSALPKLDEVKLREIEGGLAREQIAS